MNENILSINVTNWVTVTLIGLTGFFAVGLLQSYIQSKRSAQ